MADVVQIRRKSAETGAPRFHHHVDGRPIPEMPLPAPCPFCRTVSFGGIETFEGELPEDKSFHVACDQCGAEGPVAGSLLEAARGWNSWRRAEGERADDSRRREDATYLGHLVLGAVRGAIQLIDEMEDYRSAADTLRLARDRLAAHLEQAELEVSHA